MAKTNVPAMGEDTQILLGLMTRLRDLHHEFYSELSRIGDAAKQNKYNQADMTDIGYLCREAEKLLDDWRKDAAARKDLVGKILCVSKIQEMLANPRAEEHTYGNLAWGNPDNSLEAKLPEPGTPEYTLFLSSLGMPDETISSGLLKADWPKVAKLVSDLVAAGKPVPPGITKTWSKYQTVFTRRTDRKA